ncbi:archaea-specific SMC-related protein [Haloglomus litoreum]|uniref:archaea-specific SMC-related protein n=1 Tax=Haloglomus litoreum TaxID=3034026 RepID=UPI0023E8019E|nr:archaea-specific SMC-related protein [Haloglomus sp. DT116]
MSQVQSEKSAARLSVRNIGGINRTEVTFSPGVTILAGRNATNRTSLLQAIMAVLGSDQVTLKGDASEGHVELSLDGETYTRELERHGETVIADGDPYLDDPEVADLFAFLLESNEARRAVERGDDLREIIMRPIDTQAIESEIADLAERRREIDRELDDLDSLEQHLPELEEERQQLSDRIERKREELAETEARIEEVDSDIESTQEEKADLDGKLDELSDVRTEYEETRSSLRTQRESIEALEAELEELESELETLPETPMAEAGGLEGQIERLRERKRSLDSTVSELQTVIQFNEDMLAGEGSEVIAALQEDDSGSVTDQLVEDRAVACWTCGTEVEQEQITDTLDRLRDLYQEKLDERKGVQSDIDDLKTEKISYEEKQRQRDQLENRIEQTRSELERRRERVEQLEGEPERLEERIGELEAEVDALQSDTNEELLDLHKQANQQEFELGRLEDDLAEVEAEIQELEAELDRRGALEDERESIVEDLENLRTRIDRIESESVEQFNDHMETLLDILEYENLERIWIERRQATGSGRRESVDDSVFDLHVVRRSEDGASYEDTVDHLSESEREITGIVFAFAGYLTHDLHEVVPFMLLDSLEAIDAERIAELIEYVDDYADHTVVALLPEDAQAVPETYEHVQEI